MTVQQEAGTYEPRPGDRVTVRRYVAPVHGERRMDMCRTGTVTEAESHADGWFLRIDTYPDRIFTGCQFLGQGTGRADASGPASLVTEVEPAAIEAYRQQVSPELAVVTDPSQCIVLEVSDGQGRVLRRVTVTHTGVLKQALSAAYDAQQLAIEQAEQARLAGRDERRRAEGRFTRSEAVDWLIERGHSRGEACTVTRLLHAEGDRERAGMTYDGTYWRIPPAQEVAGV